jgi:hypothetical protein
MPVLHFGASCHGSSSDKYLATKEKLWVSKNYREDAVIVKNRQSLSLANIGSDKTK